MSGPVQLDETDRRILELLGEDARRTISGYTVVVDHALIGPSIEAFTELRFAGDADIDEILTSVEKIPEIAEVFTMAGDPDALLRIRVDDVEHLKVVVNRLRRTGRVTGTKTLMVLDRWAR